MIVFDTSFLVDYLDGDEDARAFLEAHEDKPFFAPALALFEAYRGGARTGGRADIETVADGLDWIDSLPMTEENARESALIEAELLQEGTPINLGDILIAGVCRHVGGRLVTRDDHFDRVEGVEVLEY